MNLLADIEQSGLAVWIRESTSLLAYPTILFLHTVGLGFLVGTSAVIDLRVLGFGSEMNLAPLQRFLPVLWFGFWISALSGVGLWVADATTLSSNPVFYIKMIAIAMAMLTIRILRSQIFPRGSTPSESTGSVTSRALACISLLLWLVAITAGRLTAYIGQ